MQRGGYSSLRVERWSPTLLHRGQVDHSLELGGQSNRRHGHFATTRASTMSWRWSPSAWRLF